MTKTINTKDEKTDMNELINIVEKDGQLVVSSRQVAEDFGKQHKDVLEAINKLYVQMSTAEFSALFIKSEYTASNGKKNPEYLLTRDGFSLLVMGFTGKAALDWKLKYIDAFNRMEKTIQKVSEKAGYLLTIFDGGTDAIVASKKLVEHETKHLTLQIENDAPKVKFAESIVANKSTITVQAFARVLSQNGCPIGRNTLYKYLIEKGYLCKNSDSNEKIPTQKTTRLKIFEVTEKPWSNSHIQGISVTSRLTPKGQQYFLERIDDIRKYVDNLQAVNNAECACV